MSDLEIIPSQSYYNLIVYDLTPSQLDNFFAAAVEMPKSDLKELTETGLDFLNDRFQDGSHTTEDDNLPDTGDILAKIERLEMWRKEFSYKDEDDYLDIDI